MALQFQCWNFIHSLSHQEACLLDIHIGVHLLPTWILSTFHYFLSSAPIQTICSSQDFVDGRLAAGEMGTGIQLENMKPKVPLYDYFIICQFNFRKSDFSFNYWVFIYQHLLKSKDIPICQLDKRDLSTRNFSTIFYQLISGYL